MRDSPRLAPDRYTQLAEISPCHARDESEQLVELIASPQKESLTQSQGHEKAASVLEECRSVVRELIEDPASSYAARFLQLTVVLMILCSTCCVFCETVPQLEQVYYGRFKFFELCFTVFFTVEFVTKMIVATGPMTQSKAMNYTIDLVATLPWYIDQTLRYLNSMPDNKYFLEESEALQLLRVLRVLRLVKAARQHGTIQVIMHCVWDTFDGLLALLVFIAISTALSACLVFFLEFNEPDTDFVSIPASIWWALPTITGVGYGDILPRTFSGKLVGAATMVIGVLITSLVGAVMTQPILENFERKMMKHNAQRLKGQSMSSFFNSESLGVEDSDELERRMSSTLPHGVVPSSSKTAPSGATTLARQVDTIQLLQERLEDEMHRLELLVQSADTEDPVLKVEQSSIMSCMRQLAEQQKCWASQWRKLVPEFGRVVETISEKEREEAPKGSYLRASTVEGLLGAFRPIGSQRGNR